MAEMPTKCVSTVATIGVEAQLVFIDFEGRTDGMSLKILLSQIKPRQLVSAQSMLVSLWSVFSAWPVRVVSGQCEVIGKE